VVGIVKWLSTESRTINGGGTRNFHLGAVTQGARGRPRWSSGVTFEDIVYIFDYRISHNATPDS